MPGQPLLPTKWGLPLGVALSVGMGVLVGHSQPDLALLAMVGVADVVAMVTTLPAALVVAAVCWGLEPGQPLLLLLVTVTAWGFASLLRAGRDHHEARLACIPTQRQDEAVSQPLQSS